MGSSRMRVGEAREEFAGRSLASLRSYGIGGGDEPALSSDGECIAYGSSRSEDNEEIYVMNSDGSERTRLTNIPGYTIGPDRDLG